MTTPAITQSTAGAIRAGMITFLVLQINRHTPTIQRTATITQVSLKAIFLRSCSRTLRSANKAVL